jgi:SAM-dependent methyltransferase
MGLDLNAVQFLLRARSQGVVFGDVLTIGRQKLDVFPVKLAQLLRRHGLPSGPFLKANAATGYAEVFFRCLGARNIFALDASSYEGATFVHDLNRPIPMELKERFDVVYDGGTLEHVFNFPEALRNCMAMTRPGGHLFLDTPGNNWFGHGFYQFSPELFYRAFSEENGYQVLEMIAHAAGPHAKWYQVADPQVVKSRVELISFTLIHLMVHAQKKRSVELFRQMPQQSDYTVIWDEAEGKKEAPTEARGGGFGKLANRCFPNMAHLFRALRTGWKLYRAHSFSNRRFFTPIDKDAQKP